MHNDSVYWSQFVNAPWLFLFSQVRSMGRNSYVSFFFLKISCEKCPEFRGRWYNDRTCLQTDSEPHPAREQARRYFFNGAANIYYTLLPARTV
jgi:hypothetical protein